MIKVSLSFDDGRKDTYRAYFEIMKKQGIPLTLNTTIGYIDKSIEKKDCPSMNEPLSMEELKILMKDKNVEIAGHGYRHNNEIGNLILGIDKLNEVLNSQGENVTGVASPQSKMHEKEIMEIKGELDKKGIKYFRTGDRKEEMSFIKRVIRKVNRKLNIPMLYYYADSPQFVRESDSYIYYSNCILKNTTMRELKYVVTKLSSQRQFRGCILNFHSILKPGEQFYEDLYSWDYNQFSDFCSFLNSMRAEGKIDIRKTSEFI